MGDRSMRSGTELAREIKLTDWSMAGNLSNRSSGVQIPRDICTRLKALFVLCEVQLDNKGIYFFQYFGRHGLPSSGCHFFVLTTF